MTEAVREAVQIQTNRLQDSLQRENDEFLLNIDENMKKIIKGKVKNQRRREDDDQEGPSAGSDWGSKRQKEGGEHASASIPFETTIGGAGRSTIGSQSRQLSASESAFIEEPVQTTCQMDEPPHPFYGYAVNWESALDVYSKRRIIAVTEIKIVEWHDYKHLDWIS
nr:hypothetical protein [Tanacetum cinerariifolium]